MRRRWFIFSFFFLEVLAGKFPPNMLIVLIDYFHLFLTFFPLTKFLSISNSNTSFHFAIPYSIYRGIFIHRNHTV